MIKSLNKMLKIEFNNFVLEYYIYGYRFYFMDMFVLIFGNCFLFIKN